MADNFPGCNDPAVVAELFKQLQSWQRQRIDDTADLTDRAMDINKQLSAYFERILLLDLGTLGVSVTALTALIPKLSTVSFPRHSFLWLIIPAWFLLLCSVFMCRYAMVMLVISNQSLFHRLKTLTDSYTVQRLFVNMRKLATALQGSEASGKIGVAADMAEKLLQEDSKQISETIGQPVVQTSSGVRFCSRWVVITLEVALILLSVFAIRLFLAV